MKKFLCPALSCLLLALGAGCSTSNSSDTGYDASQPSLVIGGVQTAVNAAGSDMSATSLAFGKVHGLQAFFTPSDCDIHGYPTTTAAPGGLSDPSYPGILTYCKTAVNDGSPETIQGGFAMAKGMVCALEHAGITWDGQPHSTTLTVDTTCFSSTQIANMGNPGTFTVTATATMPAAFNAHFSHGVQIDLPTYGTFKVAANISNNTIEFITMEDQNPYTPSETGSTYGSFDRSGGDLHYEGRMYRLDCSTPSSCGWNRHIRLYAKMGIVNSAPQSLQAISFGYSNIQDAGSPGGVLVTAGGDLHDGIKARLWNATNGAGGAPANRAQVYTIGNWVEVANAKCFTRSSDSAGTCGSGIAGLSGNSYFLLPSVGYTAGYTDAATFLGGFTGATFTTVDISTDPQP
jgi:hypothetical protein